MSTTKHRSLEPTQQRSVCPQPFSPYVQTAAISLALLIITSGCSKTGLSQPWGGEPYRVPAERVNPLRATYQPTPRMLPPVRSESSKPLDQEDKTLEALLSEGS